MTNEQIILKEQIRLMRSGTIGTTGRTIIFTNDDGQEEELPEPEPIHTYAGWQALGYRVRKGECPVVRIPIWSHGRAGAMYMKYSHFFSEAQVEKIQ